MQTIRVSAATADPPQVTRSQFERAADQEGLYARIGLNIGIGLIIIGALLMLLGFLGTEEFVADRGRILTVPAGVLFAISGGIVVWITRPTLVR